MHDMQDVCQTWLDELLLILEGRVHADATEEIETLIAKLSTLEKQLKNLLEEDSEKSERMAADEDQIEQLKARVAVLEREVEGAALVSARARLLKNICEDYGICEKNQVRCEQHLKGYTRLSKYQDRMLTRDVIRLF
jgi:predicted nuclease with TOPRIM domain